MSALPLTEYLSTDNVRTQDQTITSFFFGVIEDRITSGVNSRFDTHELLWTGLTLGQLSTLISFYNVHGITQSWAYQDIGEDSPLKYIFTEALEIENTGCSTFNVKAMAMQVFD